MRVFSLVAIVAATLLTGCAASVLSSSERSVVIRAGAAQVQSAQDLANTECAKYKRVARLMSRPAPFSPGYSFDCVL